MIIIWRGLGFLVPVIVFVCSLLLNQIFNLVRKDRYYDEHNWPFALSLVLSAVACWQLGEYLSRRTDRVAIDKVTGREFVVNKSSHSLFFVPMRWWGAILLVVALVAFSAEFRR